MNPLELKTLGELFGRDLAGWQIIPCYFLELDQHCMGTFPATLQNGEIIFVLQKRLLGSVWGKIERRRAKVSQRLVLNHNESGVCFNLQFQIEKGDMEPLFVLTEEAINSLCLTEGSFRWAPGLTGGGYVVDPSFT